MILTLGGTTVTLEDPAQYPQNEDTELVQAKERSGSGITHIEDFSVQIGTFTYNFIDMSDADYAALMGFFVNTVQGMLSAFELTDDYGVLRTVRFTKAKLSFTNTSLGHWNGNFTVEVVT